MKFRCYIFDMNAKVLWKSRKFIKPEFGLIPEDIAEERSQATLNIPKHITAVRFVTQEE